MTKRRRPLGDSYSMEMLYESESYIVVLTRYATGQPGRGWARLFELVDKHTEATVVLQDSMVHVFDRHIREWQADAPTADMVDMTLSGFFGLSTVPLRMQ